MTCLGCGRSIPWDGQGTFCYTCFCGATVFVGDRGLALPASLGMALAQGKVSGHLDYYLGVSSYTSELKRGFIQALRARGATWSWECPECRVKGRCPFRWQCPRFTSLSPDDKAVVAEVCMTVRHTDCPRYQGLRDEVAAIEANPH